MKIKALTAIAALLISAPAFVAADVDAELVVNGEIELVTKTAAAPHLAGALDEVISGWRFRADETQSLQTDDFDNPGMIFVDQGMDDWGTVDGSEGKSCASCHGDVEEGMAGVRAVYPKWNETAGEVRTIAQM
ncbi:MAG: sulfur oxidation c-type cytochrome SoxA, partial [Paracoccaceae bacterium]|nr:sulfur oxidation c-type cytochrome SoxA [Paracoccaceae bacterium]